MMMDGWGESAAPYLVEPIMKMIAREKKRGLVTYDEINTVFPFNKKMTE